MEVRSIAVVGAGYSGTLLALQLLDRLPAGGRVTLIGRDAVFGRGLAYTVEQGKALLNVPAGRMSAFAGRPDDFIDWLRARDGCRQSGDFVPRALYGDYLQDLLTRALAEPANRDRLILLQAEVADIEPAGEGFRLHLSGGGEIAADRAVLAIGNFGPVPVPLDDPWLYGSRFFRPNPWAPDLFDGLDADAPVLTIGSGLTMVDAVMALIDRGHRGPIHAISRRGLRPRRHGGVPTAPYGLSDVPPRMRDLARFIHREAKARAAAGQGWQAVTDGLRPISQPLWQGWSEAERARFLRHLRPWWDVHRHRIAPEIADRLDAVTASGQMHWHTGRLLGFEDRGDRVEARYRLRGRDECASIPAALVVNTSGPNRDFDRIEAPLVQALRRRGRLRADAMHLGIDVTAGCKLRDRDGGETGLYALGPLTIGQFWEIIAVPDLRNQIPELVQRLLPV